MAGYDTWITTIYNFNGRQCPGACPPHCSNLLHQLNKRETEKQGIFANICEKYFEIRKELDKEWISQKDFTTSLVEKTNKYMDIFKTSNPFLHQADFASSIIPEMLYLVFLKIITVYSYDLSVSAQKDLSVECLFDLNNGGRILFKNKKVDVSIVKKCELNFNNQSFDFLIPLVAIEVKTNLDKNMISGIENSVHSLKQTFPKSLYYVVTELSDFDVRKLNYAASDINEIYVLRKQKRAPVRRDPSLKNDIDAELVIEIVEKIHTVLSGINGQALDITERMRNGKLIGR